MSSSSAAPASPLRLHVAPASLAPGTTSWNVGATPSLLPSARGVQLMVSSCQHPDLV